MDTGDDVTSILDELVVGLGAIVAVREAVARTTMPGSTVL